MNLPEIPRTWLIALFLGGMVALRTMGIDTFVTAGLSVIMGYLFGVHTTSENQKKEDTPPTVAVSS